jgi:hypothetical protein
MKVETAHRPNDNATDAVKLDMETHHLTEVDTAPGHRLHRTNAPESLSKKVQFLA